ncbi:MAG: MmgE/PrpD family protein, partial [Micromonosporaceae bacterium]
MTEATPTPLTALLAEWAAGLSFEDLPDAVVHQAKRVILDYLAAVAAGSASDSAQIVQKYLGQNAAEGPAAVVGSPLRLAPASAALGNGAAAHGLEVDDGYTPGGYHPGAPTLSA